MVALKIVLWLIPAMLCAAAAKPVAERRGVTPWPWMALSFVFTLLGLLATVLLASRFGRPVAE